MAKAAEMFAAYEKDIKGIWAGYDLNMRIYSVVAYALLQRRIDVWQWCGIRAGRLGRRWD